MEKWTRDQTIIVLRLYCQIPFSKATSTNPYIIYISKLIGRSPNSVKMKIGNFGSFDENLKTKGIVGLTNTSKLDRDIWNEYSNNWDKLAYQSELLIADLEKRKKLNLNNTLETIPVGIDKEVFTTQRINQNFFRNTILASYNSKCCITGISIPDLLIASHIIPWSIDKKNRTNPHNGLCLNSLHDKAFDKGLISISTEYRIKISDKIKSIDNKAFKDYFYKYENSLISLPEKFLPSKDFLDYHFNNIFQK